MAAANKKSTYTASEVAELIRPLADSIELLQKENAELKQKLEHMNEVFANAQRTRFNQSSEKNSYVLHDRPVFSTRQKKNRPPKRKNLHRTPFLWRLTSGKRNAVRQKC